MPSDPNIGKREREVLTAIVETFISTGEPVGSRTSVSYTHLPTVLGNYKQHAIGFLIPFIVLGSLGVMIYGIRKGQDKLAFVASAFYIVGMLVGAAFALYPVVLPASTDPVHRSLTIYNTAAGHHGLTVGLIWWIPAMILALAYFTLLFRMFKGKVQLEGEGY